MHVKLADRLDNTLDMRIDLEDPLAGVDFFQNIFQLLFVNNYRGYKPANDHPPASAMNGARRLYQLFKNTVLLSLIRQHNSIHSDHALSVLFEAVCDASLQEAQRTLIHLIGFHVKERQLDILYQDKKLMIQASIAFVVIFLHFLNDSQYYIHGISLEGIEPK